MATVYDLLEKKLRLYIKKVSLMGKVFAEKPHYILSYKDLNSLRLIVSREIAVNRRLLKIMKLRAEGNSSHLDPSVVKFEAVTRELIFVLRHERRVLRKIGLPNLAMHELGVVLFRQSQTKHFDLVFSRFRALHKHEQDLDAKLFIIASEQSKKIASTNIKMYERMAGEIRMQYGALAKSVTSAMIQKNAKDLLALVKKLQETEIYTYMREDILLIKRNVEDTIKHPDRSKVKLILATAYMFTPGTFETTASILLIKNLTKFTFRRIKNRVPKAKKHFIPKPRSSRAQ